MVRYSKILGSALGLAMAGALAAPAHAASCGVQTSPDGLRLMANRDVGTERWAITRHPSGIVTGNVFRSDGGAPAFIACGPGNVANQYVCLGGSGCLSPAAAPGAGPRAVSTEPLGELLLVNKSVGAERWAITENDDGSITGNVFSADGGAPAFIFCEPNAAPDGYTCFGAESCGAVPCGDDFTPLGDVTLPPGFLDKPAGCADEYEVIGDAIVLPEDLFLPEGCQAGGGGSEIEIFVESGSTLDPGWNGTVHGLQFQRGARIAGELVDCDTQSDEVCEFFGDVGSSCSGDPSRACTTNNHCSGAGQCVIRHFGPPLPLSVGGIPACILTRFTTDAVGTYDLQSGAMTFSLGLNALAHLTLGGSDPCPICDCGATNPQSCAIGDSGTCGGLGGGACTVHGTGPFGPTSLDCLPSASSNVTGSGIELVFDSITTDTLTFPASRPCANTAYQDFDCWCDGQAQPNQCGLACDGGANDTGLCDTDAQCPGGRCAPLCRQVDGAQAGKGECVAGPVVQTCAGSPQTSCNGSGDCPADTGPCVSRNQSCFPDPLVLEGMPGTTSNRLVASGCVPAAGGAMDQAAGLPGPATLVLPSTVTTTFCGDGITNGLREECDGSDDAACPGMCDAQCSCGGTCGNDLVEVGEQCDGLDDAACPGQCLADACQCEGSSSGQCGNQVLDPGEVCEFPALGCGPLQLCLFCGECWPPPGLIPLPF